MIEPLVHLNNCAKRICRCQSGLFDNKGDTNTVTCSFQSTPSPSHNTSTGPMSFLEGTPVTDGGGILHSQAGDGYCSPRWGYPSTGQGGTPSWVPPDQIRMGTPRQVMLEQVMLRAVRLLQFPAGGLSCLSSVFIDGSSKLPIWLTDSFLAIFL